MAKKVAKKSSSEMVNLLDMEAPANKRFFLNDGRSLGTIRELKDTLEDMDDSVFQHHVTDERNDFANWIRDVFSQSSLADKVSNMRSQFNMARTIAKYDDRGCGYL